MEKKVVLIVDKDTENRERIESLLMNKYQVFGFETCNEGIAYIKEHCTDVSAILLDISGTVMEGYSFLKTLNEKNEWKNIPVIVTADSSDNDGEKRALELGAWDFIHKPYEVDIILTRLKNAIYRSQFSAFVKLKYLAEYDSLTGLYNKTKFFDVTRQMLLENTDKRFVFWRFDIDRFQMVNSFFGISGGDKLLTYISEELKRMYSVIPFCTFGRIESDIFGVCHIYDESNILQRISEIRNMLSKYNPEYDIIPNIGLYVVEDNNLPVETLFNRATLAANYSKGNYVKFYTFYNEKMSSALIKEQEIINDMKGAIETEQFDIYFQPKYNLQTNKPYGAEALVRWFHPTKGMIMPGEFIPIFEKNGFISKLDFYVWEKACKYLRSWIDAGRNPYPISVNMSRVNMYNPKIVEIIKGITDKYDISPSLLNLELTESAYTDNPIAIKEIISRLQAQGFIIMMDDFGSGYSSLNVLKDISVDVLKVDMRFLSNTDIPGRGDNILASVIRMAKWLNLPVIVEGVETARQSRFLRSIGCDYVQGFYFASPMPADEYLKLIDENKEVVSNKLDINEKVNFDSFFEKNPQMEIIFGNRLQAIVIYEFSDDRIELLRVNEGFYNLFGSSDRAIKSDNPLVVIDEEYKDSLLGAFWEAVNTKGTSEAEYIRYKEDGTSIWVKIRLQYIQKIGMKHILFGTLNDITIQKEIDTMLDIYKEELNTQKADKDVMLVVDDYRLNRIILRDMFQDKFQVLEAENGNVALQKLLETEKVDVIILDLIMPCMDGKELLQIIKKDDKRKNIPVVVITSDDSIESQTELLSLGVNDYIIKPFVKETVMKRIDNVMVSSNNRSSIQRKSDIADKLSELLK